MNIPLPLSYSDPDAYLVQPQLHLSTTFHAPFLPPDAPLQRVTYAAVGDPTGPVLVLINGMGGNRMFAWTFDGIAEQYQTCFVTFDRPSCGGSTPCPLRHRVEWTFHALLAILLALPSRPTTFSIFSHSNGLIYTLYILLHLPPHLTVSSWHLVSPFVPPWLSGSLPLTVARWIPASVTANLGTVVGTVLKNVGPIGTWSSGMARASLAVSGGISGWVGAGGALVFPQGEGGDVVGGASPGPPAATAVRPDDPPAMELAKFRYRNAARPAHKRLFGRYYYSEKCAVLAQEFLLAEGTDAFGPEALLSFRIGDGGDRWGWGGPEGDEEREGAEEALVYERGFEALKRRMDAAVPGTARLRLQVVWGMEDGLIPVKGREYLRTLVQTRLGLVKEEDWLEIEGAGHDEVTGLALVADAIFEFDLEN